MSFQINEKYLKCVQTLESRVLCNVLQYHNYSHTHNWTLKTIQNNIKT